MLLREVVARHLPTDGSVAVVAEHVVLDDLRLVAQQVSVGEPAEGAADLLLLDVGDGRHAADLLAKAPAADLVVLLLQAPLAELPLGPLAALGGSAGLHYVDAVPVTTGRYSCAVVAAPLERPVRAFLTGTDPDGDRAAAAARRTWEWGLGGLVTAAREKLWEQERAALEAEVQAAEHARADALRQVDAAHAETLAAEQRLARLESSPALQLGRDLVSLRRHPVRGSRALLRDALQTRRQRRQR